mmetsp:Transcript_5757/g.6614  ORF Transcript_5757/g.6614 Transcript_5757/m.6614 type:complete len:214 (+) Transcript_5757:140-781(+)|eukprot:CAMPEP_0197846416 /NCGR_PEP_ID=MMETSP1438-20131217/3159_1 /TAXON_ID=1461541 /ORGANISM="Pterosperma sp., Strain CCMP1384" /LENGTH=213 /DNA_ID=CAMNT_0043458057 /DNA_START=140 /DNA_END=781 /DNA_ORIENTATION=-
MKLYYFPLYGVGEQIRMLLAHAKVEYDNEMPTGDSWKEFKPNCPNGQMPVLEVDGKMLHQSQAIMRFLGKQHGYYPSDAMAAFAVDAAVEDWNDSGKNMSYMSMFKPEPFPEEELKVFMEGMNKKYECIAKILAKNGGKFLCGDAITTADFTVFASLCSWAVNQPTEGKEHQRHVYTACAEAMAKHPTVQAYVDAMKAELAGYLAARPKDRTI